MRVDEVGKTTEGRPFLIVTLTSEANMARLEEIRRDNLRLADPRGLGEEEAAAIVAPRQGDRGRELRHPLHRGRGHTTAVVSAHRLATSDEGDVLEILERPSSS